MSARPEGGRVLTDDNEPQDGEPRRFLPDGRPIATKRKKKKPGSAPEAPVGESGPLVPDLLVATVPSGGRVIVVSGLLLGQNANDATEAATGELTRELDRVHGPGVLVLAGNTFDLAGEGHLEPSRALLAHPRFASSLSDFAEVDGHRVVVLPGNRDSCLAWHPQAIQVLQRRLHAEVALAADLTLTTGEGDRRVRVEPGHQFDPYDSFDDPRNRGESPIGQHAIESFQNLRRDGGSWLEGIQYLVDLTMVGTFMASRLFYRRLVRRFGWILLPVLAAFVAFVVSLVLMIPENRSTGRHAHYVEGLRVWAAALGIVGVGIMALFAIVGGLWWWTVRDPIRAVTFESLGGATRNDEPNEPARAMASRLVGQQFAGLVTGYSNKAEVADLGRGFYANTGCCGAIAVRREGRFGAPDAWVVGYQQSWVELEAGARIHVRLHFARQQPPTTTLLERLLTRKVVDGTAHPEVVGAWPAGPDWPVHRPQGVERRRARRIAAFGIAFSGLVDLVSGVAPPFRGRIDAVLDVVPIAVSQAATMLVVLSGLMLLLVARGLRRGQRHAWLIAEFALSLTFVLHVVKGLDFEESIVSLVLGLYLLANRRHFRVQADDWSMTRGLVVLAGGALAAVATATLAIKAIPGHHHEALSWFRAMEAGAERMVGVTHIYVSPRADRFLVPSMVAVSVGLVVYAGWLLFGPVVAKRLAVSDPADEDRARQLVATHGGDTLAYFALRDDKRWFFHGETLVAYAVTQGVALVSPDPIGPVAERRKAWFAFRQFADDHGWPIAVMAASEEWLPIYRSTGMREMYVGDEAVADVRRFNLDGGKNKGLRQAVNRIANNGYRMEFHDPTEITANLEAGLRGLMTESRRGEMERGFSMTLGRIFDPRDTGLLLAVCFGPDNVPAAFCQYVPASAVNGFSLDLMRRSERGDHPNGLTDYVVVETIRHLREQGMVGLGLNFATMRGVLAGERGDNMSRRVERWFYSKMSDSMQIESLWKYNDKFDPDWIPRYACYDSAEHLLVSATALAKAESWWEIPVVGRFFRPSGDGSPMGLPALPDPECDVPVPEVPTSATDVVSDDAGVAARTSRPSSEGFDESQPAAVPAGLDD